MLRISSTMRVTIALATAALAAGTSFANASAAEPWCAPGQRSDASPAETVQFEFLLGRHTVTLHAWQNGQWTPPRPVDAVWRGWYGLDGRAIVDEWIDPDTSSAPGGNRGINVRMFDPKQNVWKMMWISDTARVVQDLRAEMRNGVLTMWQVYPERPGWKAEFEVSDDAHWARVSYLQNADGTWRPQYRLAATEVPCRKS